MRGKGVKESIQLSSVGITPAHAGKRSEGINPTIFGRDHPRACGEKRTPDPLRVMQTGSPPRMRGKVIPTNVREGVTRITPAHAGKRPRRSETVPNTWDHPRACGEKRRPSPLSATNPGSPPRMRGKVAFQLVQRSLKGITPAHAGKSRRCTCIASGSWDHPRACGEKLCLL